MQDRIKELRRVPASELAANPKNWREHPPEQRQALEAMLGRIGMAAAVIARETDDGELQLIDGHLRADIADDEQVPVLVVDLDESEADQMLASFDPLGAMAQADADALAALLETLDEPPDIDYDALYGLPADLNGAGGIGSDDAPAPPDEPITQPGDLWILGDHRLICGDCTDKATVERLTDGEAIDCILTDPPYCSGGFQEAGKSAGSKGTDVEYKPIANDRLSTRGYQALIKACLSAVTAEIAYIFTDWRMWVYLFDLSESSGFGVRSMIVWNKGTPGMGMGWRSQHELILCGTKVNGLWKDRQADAIGNVITLSRQPNELHATQKPVELLDAILGATPFVEVLYDPFVGSGTTLIAAERQQRRCYAVELDPAYCDVAVQRWEGATGQTAERVEAV